ncbi:MAG: SIR2 family protein [Leptolyngbyaceae cyanobacterium MO_188.B28]|nr:SIR2 family protein [Leptolyngbyaceae cyanobacterium MO_188.B28]
MEESKVDFAIITAIQLERQAVCQALGMGDQHRVREGVRTYWKTQLDLGSRQFYTIVVTQLPDAANVDAAIAVGHVIDKWNPGAVLMVGIAGAAKADIHPGDVVLGQKVYYYERGKESPTGKLPQPEQYPADPTLWDRVINVAKWESQIPVTRPDGTDTPPTIHQGVIASGEKVIASAEVRSEIVSTNRQIAAIEMEGYGVSAAAWKQDRSVPCLVIRAISDRADAQKNDDWQPYAAAVAAEFTKHFLLDRPLPPQKSPPPPIPIPDFLNRYRLIINALKAGSLVPFLGPGINSSFYIELALNLTQFVQKKFPFEREEDRSPNEQLIQSLVGVPCTVCPYWPKERPDECPMLRSMNGSANIEDHPIFVEQRLAVSKINLRYISQYYILKDELDFYEDLYGIVEKLEKTHQPSSLHKALAKLPHLMLGYSAPRSNPGLPFQLIVTTNYDDMLEQAFSAAKQPYDVVFYIADGPEKGSFKHKPYGGEIQTIGAADSKRLPLPSYSDQPRPIILKLYGTWEESWQNYFVSTEQQMAYLISILQQKIPTALLTILRRNKILFMGFSPSDSDLQFLVNCIWEGNRINKKSFLLHQAKPGHLEQELWKDRNVTLLNMSSSVDDFVAQLQEAIEVCLSSNT